MNDVPVPSGHRVPSTRDDQHASHALVLVDEATTEGAYCIRLRPVELVSNPRSDDQESRRCVCSPRLPELALGFCRETLQFRPQWFLNRSAGAGFLVVPNADVAARLTCWWHSQNREQLLAIPVGDT